MSRCLSKINFFAASSPLIRQERQQMRNEKGWLVIQMSSAEREISGWNGWKKETIRKEISDRLSNLKRGESAVVRRQNRAARRQGTEMMAMGAMVALVIDLPANNNPSRRGVLRRLGTFGNAKGIGTCL
jgi:hypothetical protein